MEISDGFGGADRYRVRIPAQHGPVAVVVSPRQANGLVQRCGAGADNGSLVTHASSVSMGLAE